MKVSDAYKTFLLKMNEAATSRGVAVNKGKFCVLFNKNYLTVVNEYLEEKGSDEIDKIKELLVPYKQLQHLSKGQNYDSFTLPKDYMEYSNFEVRATSDQGCSDQIKIFPVKSREVQNILQDQYNKPTFFYREAPFTLALDSIRIYTDRFEVEDVYMDYYKEPRKISLINSSDPESNFIDNEFEASDFIINKVIDRTVVEYSLSHEDYNKYQAESSNIKQNQ